MTIEEIFEKYKHLDTILSDPAWTEGEHHFLNHIAGELWQAIKEAQPEDEKTEALEEGGGDGDPG